MREKDLDISVLDELVQKAQFRAQKDLEAGYPEHKEKPIGERYWEIYWKAYDEAMGNKERICPSCGAKGDAIKMVQDKVKILEYINGIPIYTRKFVCKKCGFEF